MPSAASELLELLTKDATYELHASNCELLVGTSPCDCSGPDLLKEIKEVLARDRV